MVAEAERVADVPGAVDRHRPNAVRNHVTHIFEKLHVATRAEAVARARDMGLGDG